MSEFTVFLSVDETKTLTSALKSLVEVKGKNINWETDIPRDSEFKLLDGLIQLKYSTNDLKKFRYSIQLYECRLCLDKLKNKSKMNLRDIIFTSSLMNKFHAE